MKKLSILALVFGIMSFTAKSQDLKSKRGEPFLPEKGDWAIGFNADGIFSYIGNAFNGTIGNDAPSVGFQNAGTFVGKKFVSDKMAYRVIANFAVNSSKVGENSNNGFALAFGLGKEWRKGKTRLQGFYGADAMVSVASNTKKEVNANITKTTKSGLGFGVGANGFIGAEYFIFPKISMGAQYTFGLNIAVAGKSKIEETGQTTIDGNSSTNINLGGVGIASINVNLHF